MILRKYQEDVTEGARVNLRDHRSTLIVLPCGGGKGSLTTTFVKGVVERGKRVDFAVRGLALVNDMSRRLHSLGLPHGVLRGGAKRDLDNPVQVASVNTLHRLEDRAPADLVVMDEARTFSNKSGRRIFDSYPQTTKFIGLDATPVLINGKGLGVAAGGFFESIVVGPDEQDLIDQGFLCPSLPIGTGDPPDVSGIGRGADGDFEKEALAAACNKPKLVGDIVAHWHKEAYGLKTIAFGVNRKHAQAIRDAFLAAGVEWEYVDGETPDDVREAIYERLDNGTLMGISNVGIAGVGWDHPCIACVICGQPTESLSKWRQMMGRGSRIYPGKLRFVILDHAGNTVRHWPYGLFEVPPIWTLEGLLRGRKSADAKEATGDPISMCKRPVRISGAPPPGFSGGISDDGRYMLPCFCYFKSGPSACPRCGLPLIVVGRKIETEAGELRDLSDLKDIARKVKSEAQLTHENKMMDRYLTFVVEAATRLKKNGDAYSPNWPTMQFKLEFNRFPDKALRDAGDRVREGIREAEQQMREGRMSGGY